MRHIDFTISGFLVVDEDIDEHCLHPTDEAIADSLSGHVADVLADVQRSSPEGFCPSWGVGGEATTVEDA